MLKHVSFVYYVLISNVISVIFSGLLNGVNFHGGLLDGVDLVKIDHPQCLKQEWFVPVSNRQILQLGDSALPRTSHTSPSPRLIVP